MSLKKTVFDLESFKSHVVFFVKVLIQPVCPKISNLHSQSVSILNEADWPIRSKILLPQLEQSISLADQRAS